MAQISLNVEGEVNVSKADIGDGCIEIKLHLEMGDAGRKFTYTKDSVFLHGNLDQIRSFADKILAALPVKQEVAA